MRAFGLCEVLGALLEAIKINGRHSMMSRTSHIARRRFEQGKNHYTATTYLFITLIGGGLQLFGIDHPLTITAHFAIAMTAIYAIFAAMRYGLLIRQITSTG